VFSRAASQAASDVALPTIQYAVAGRKLSPATQIPLPLQLRSGERKQKRTLKELEEDAGGFQLKAGIVVERIAQMLPDVEDWEDELFPKVLDRQIRQNITVRERLPASLVKKYTEEYQKFVEKDDTLRPKTDRVTEIDERLRVVADPLSPDAIHLRKSLIRSFGTSLFLLVKKNRNSNEWQFPQGSLKEDESVKDAAQRELREECGKGLKVWFIGNAPIGHVEYKYPSVNKSGHKGAKVFFQHAIYLEGDIQLNGEELVDYIWVTKQELPLYVKSPELLEVSKRMLVTQDESHYISDAKRVPNDLLDKKWNKIEGIHRRDINRLAWPKPQAPRPSLAELAEAATST